jgi:predicted nucleotidyltransferase
MNPHFELLERAHGQLSGLNQRFVFVGGATVSLHIDDPASGPARATKDVDLVVEVTGYIQYAAIEERLREMGFQQDLGEDDTPICRWMKTGLVIDVLPTAPEILGFGESKWFREGFEHACQFTLPTGTMVEAFGPIHLMAAKIEAFEDRGDGDWLLSQDIEDLATILDGRITIFEELGGSDEAATFVRQWIKHHAAELLDPIAGNVGDYGRARHLVQQIRALRQ